MAIYRVISARSVPCPIDQTRSHVRLIGTEEGLPHDHLWTPQEVSTARSSGDSFYVQSSQITEKAYVHCVLCPGCSQVQTVESDSRDPTLMIGALRSLR